MSDDNTQDGAEPSPASAGSHATLVNALRILAREIYCEDGVATQCITQAASEIERLRLTAQEREAIDAAYRSYWVRDDVPGRMIAVAIRGFLDRTK